MGCALFGSPVDSSESSEYATEADTSEYATESSESVSHVSEHTGSAEDSSQVGKAELIRSISQMMFVSGETAEPSVETTTMIEELVRQQVHEMVGRPA